MSNNIFKNIIICIGAAAIVAASILMPGFFLKKILAQKYNTVSEVPTKYYSGPSEAVVKNASKQLSELQKIQLISELWESEISAANSSEANISELEAKDLAIDRLTSLSSNGLFPANAYSDYQKWYSWTAVPYKAVDTTFRTYAAIYWDVTFTKYDNSESHRIILTESGDILYAFADTNEKSLDGFTPKLENINSLFINNTDDTDKTDAASGSFATIENNAANAYEINNDFTKSAFIKGQNYIQNLESFDVTGGVDFTIAGGDKIMGTMLYGTDNGHYTFFVVFKSFFTS